MFRKSPKNRLYQDVVDQIQTAILEGQLQPGDKLPPQREMAEIFQTSVPPVREALRVLEQKGLIELKLGITGGAIVRKANTEQVGESLALLIKHQQVPVAQLSEFQEFVDGYVAALAAERAKTEDVEYLKTLLAEAKVHLEKGISHLEAFDQADHRVNVALAHISRNLIFISIIEMIHEHLHLYYQKLPKEDENLMRSNYEDLCDIVSAVEHGRSIEARALAQTHVRRFYQFVIKEQKKQQ